jgi:3'-phosphoadenosine 5'-phosphosulfate sulfotransferase (PAPS reductase)/FAD synthetase
MTITHAFSFGGGVQSTACLVLAATGRLPEYKHFVMADVGEDSENPATLDYLEQVAKPYAEKHGLSLVVIPRLKRDGTQETLLGRLTKHGSRSLPIPVRMSETGAPGTRSCTADFKIKVLAKWSKANGATEEHPMIVGIGISTDEASRARSDSGIPHQILDYPLIRLSAWG